MSILHDNHSPDETTLTFPASGNAVPYEHYVAADEIGAQDSVAGKYHARLTTTRTVYHPGDISVHTDGSIKPYFVYRNGSLICSSESPGECDLSQGDLIHAHQHKDYQRLLLDVRSDSAIEEVEFNFKFPNADNYIGKYPTTTAKFGEYPDGFAVLYESDMGVLPNPPLSFDAGILDVFGFSDTACCVLEKRGLARVSSEIDLSEIDSGPEIIYPLCANVCNTLNICDLTECNLKCTVCVQDSLAVVDIFASFPCVQDTLVVESIGEMLSFQTLSACVSESLAVDMLAVDGGGLSLHCAEAIVQLQERCEISSNVPGVKSSLDDSYQIIVQSPVGSFGMDTRVVSEHAVQIHRYWFDK
jgi:hypothetical protein